MRYLEQNHIAGFIFNRWPERLVPLAQSLCDALGTTYFGCFPRTSLTFESRHLGLVKTDEIADILAKLDALGRLAGLHICLEKLLALVAPAVSVQPPRLLVFPGAPIIAVARDSAFCFQYAENLKILEEMGCFIRYFPL